MSEYRILPSAPFEASLRRLERHYPHVRKDVQAAFDRLRSRPELGKAVPRWRRRVWKLRIKSTDIRRGARFGLRFIYYLEAGTIIPLLVYAKPDKTDVSDREIVRLLQEIGRGP